MRSYFPENSIALALYVVGKKQGGGGGKPITPSGNWITKVTDTTSGYLSESEMKQNADLVYDYFYQKLQWNVNSVMALLGNIQGESTLNPGLIEVGGGTTSAGAGRGLVQWTPASDLYAVLDVLYGKHDDWYDGNKQLAVIFAEYQEASGEASLGIEKQWYSTTEYPISFKEWAFNTRGYLLEDLVYAFARNYLRPAVWKQPVRYEYAQKWAEIYLKG